MNVFRPLNMIDYQTYKYVSKYDFLVALAMLVSGVCLKNFPLIFGGVLGEYLDFYLNRYKAIYNVREIHELDLLLQEFLCSYSKLNKTFSLENPIEIMLLYAYLLNNGYLSFQKKHSSELTNKHDYVVLNSYQVFTGEFVCRHNAALLTRILKFEGISSGILLTHLSLELNLDSELANKFKEIEEFVKFLEKEELSPEVFKKINVFMEKLWQEGKITASDLEIEDKNDLGNHAITVAKYNGKNYYLDPTKELILYNRIINGKKLLANGINFNVPFVSFLARESYAKRCEKISKVKKFLVGPESTYEEEMEARVKIPLIIQDNQDILESFYRENEPLYEEMTDKLVRVRAKMKPKVLRGSKTEQ